MTSEQWLLGAVGALNVVLGLVVFARNPKLSSSRYFAALTFSVFAWCVGLILYFQATSVAEVTQSARYFYISALWMNTFLLQFTIYFCNAEKLKRFIVTPIAISMLMTIYIAFSSTFFLETVVLTDAKGASITVKTMPYLSYVVIIMGYYLVNLYSFSRAYAANTGVIRARIGTMLLAFSVAGLFASYFNVYLPYNGDYSLVWVGPLFTLGFVGLFTYAILRFKLFGIRLIVAKTFGYIATLSIVAVAPIVILAPVINEQLIALEGVNRIVAIILLYVAMLSIYQPTKRLLNRVTSGIFYRDTYNTQEVIDSLTGIAVTEFDIDNLASSSLHVLSEALKSGATRFILVDSSGDFYSDYKTGNQEGLQSLPALKMLSLQDTQMIHLDDQEGISISHHTETARNHELRQYLMHHGVTISIRLSTKDEIVGYLLLGPKLSGNIYSKQDIDFIGIAANELAIAIQNARRFDEIKRFNETLRLEIDSATSELRSSNEKLQALDQAKDEFISMASHQLRTPLTSVKGYLSMILDGDVGDVDKKQRDMLVAAFTSSQRMVYLISDLLNVSRLQTGKFVIAPVVSDLPEVIEGEIQQLKETAKMKELEITLKTSKNFPDVYLDETKTRQVIMNFIDNAIYYTPRGGKIDVELSHNDNKIEYTVTDNGIGVPKSEQKNMFTKFYRASNAKKARPDGTGLGLFMAKKVIIDQGGAVIFNSKEGEGSTFGFTFPMTRVRPPKSETKKSEPKAKKSKGKKQSEKQSK